MQYVIQPDQISQGLTESCMLHIYFAFILNIFVAVRFNKEKHYNTEFKMLFCCYGLRIQVKQIEAMGNHYGVVEFALRMAYPNKDKYF